MGGSIATRTGDDGQTSLLYGQRVAKDHPQIEAIGACDELNVALGTAKSLLPADSSRRGEIELIQHTLIALMGELACAEADIARYEQSKFKKLGAEDLAQVDAAIAALEAKKISFAGWATPGATPQAAALDVARTTARRAERRVVSLARHGRIVRPLLLHYLNRVSDLLWLLAREAETS